MRLGVERAHGIGGQVVVDHRKAQAIEVWGVFQGAAFARNDHRQVVGVRLAKAELGIRRLECVGATQQVDAAVAQRGNRLVAVVETPDFDRDAQLLGDDACIIGAQALVIMLADVDFERRVIRPRTAQHQAAALLQPLAVLVAQLQGRCGADRARQQLPRFAVGKQAGGAGQADDQ
ncbi:hypothetical protein D3C79_826480 [compost metagenome]